MTYQQRAKIAVTCSSCNGGGVYCDECEDTGLAWEGTTLEELTAEAVKAERERMVAEVEHLVHFLDETPERDQSREEGLRAAYDAVINLLEPPEPEPRTPKSSITKALNAAATDREDDVEMVTGYVLSALLSDGFIEANSVVGCKLAES